MRMLKDWRHRPRASEHEAVPEWVRRELQAHDRNLDVVFYRWWAGSNQEPGQEAAGRFLVVVRSKIRERVASAPIGMDGQLNLGDWHIVHVVEHADGSFKRPDRDTVEIVRRGDLRNAEPTRWVRETRERSDRARMRRKAVRRKDRAMSAVPDIRGALAGRVSSLVPAKIGG